MRPCPTSGASPSASASAGRAGALGEPGPPARAACASVDQLRAAHCGAISTSLLVYVALVASALLNGPAEVYLWSRPKSRRRWLGGKHSTATTSSWPRPSSPIRWRARSTGGLSTATSWPPFTHRPSVALVHALLSPPTPRSPSAARIFDQTVATLVALGPRERALGATDLSHNRAWSWPTTRTASRCSDARRDQCWLALPARVALLARLLTGRIRSTTRTSPSATRGTWREGLGLVYNPGDWVLGTTAPLWAVILGLRLSPGLRPAGLATALSARVRCGIGWRCSRFSCGWAGGRAAPRWSAWSGRSIR